MSVMMQLKAYHLARLNDKRPQVRIESIQELALLGTVDVLSTLERIYHTDPDPGVRQAAQEAGRVLFRLSRQVSEPSRE